MYVFEHQTHENNNDNMNNNAEDVICMSVFQRIICENQSKCENNSTYYIYMRNVRCAKLIGNK